MAKTRSELKTMIIRSLKINNDSVAIAGLDVDLDVACGIIAPKKKWPELMRRASISLTAADGDTVYPLDSTCDNVEQMVITSPGSYGKELKFRDKRMVRAAIPDKTIPGTSTPSVWYFSEPTVSTANVATKNVSFDARPDQAYTIQYSYKAYAPSLDSDDKYPFFDGKYHHGLYYYGCWKVSERLTDPAVNPIYWRGEWENFLEGLEQEEQGDTTDPLQIPAEGE